MEAVAAEFAKQRPDVKVVLVGKGSLESAQSILDGKDKPTVWSPADGLALRLLQADWQTKNRADLFATAGEDAPQALVITPLVFAIWEDRADVLLKASGGPPELPARVGKNVLRTNCVPVVNGRCRPGRARYPREDPAPGAAAGGSRSHLPHTEGGNRGHTRAGPPRQQSDRLRTRAGRPTSGLRESPRPTRPHCQGPRGGGR